MQGATIAISVKAPRKRVKVGKQIVADVANNNFGGGESHTADPQREGRVDDLRNRYRNCVPEYSAQVTAGNQDIENVPHKIDGRQHENKLHQAQQETDDQRLFLPLVAASVIEPGGATMRLWIVRTHATVFPGEGVGLG